MVKFGSSHGGMDRGNGGEVKKVDKVARVDMEEKGRENNIWRSILKLNVLLHPRSEQQRGTLWRDGEHVSDNR